MEKEQRSKKASIIGIVFAFLWFSFWLLGVIGLLEEAEKDYPTIIVGMLLSAIGLLIGINGIKERKKPVDILRPLLVEEEWIRDTLVHDFQLNEKKATDIFHYYIEDIYELNSHFYIPWRDWATHIHRAHEKNMTKEEWLMYVEELKETIPDSKKHQIRDVKDIQAQYTQRIERLQKENEQPGVNPSRILQKIGDMWGFVVVILLVGSVIGFEQLSWETHDFINEYAHIFTIVYMVGLMTINFGSHALYMKWFERKYATFHENEKEIKELEGKRWLADEELDVFVHPENYEQ